MAIDPRLAHNLHASVSSTSDRVSSKSPRPCVTSTHRLQGSWWSIPVHTVTERIWPLLYKVLNGLVYEICEIYIDDALIHGKSEAEFLRNVRRVFERLCAKNVAVNPKQTKLGLPEVEYVGHLVSATGTSFTPEKRLKVLDFPQPLTQNEMLHAAKS